MGRYVCRIVGATLLALTLGTTAASAGQWGGVLWMACATPTPGFTGPAVLRPAGYAGTRCFLPGPYGPIYGWFVIL